MDSVNLAPCLRSLATLGNWEGSDVRVLGTWPEQLLRRLIFLSLIPAGAYSRRRSRASFCTAAAFGQRRLRGSYGANSPCPLAALNGGRLDLVDPRPAPRHHRRPDRPAREQLPLSDLQLSELLAATQTVMVAPFVHRRNDALLAWISASIGSSKSWGQLTIKSSVGLGPTTSADRPIADIKRRTC